MKAPHKHIPHERRGVATLFSALGDETRLRLVATLASNDGCSISELTAGSRLTRQAVTKHLRVLRTAGLVESEKLGREHRFALNPSPIRNIQEYLGLVSRSWKGKEMKNKESAIEFLKSVANGKVQEAYDRFIAPGFIHHNQFFKGDRQSLLNAMAGAAKSNPTKSLEVKQAFEDGSSVITHSWVKPSPEDLGAAVIHIFKFDAAGKVIELWDLGQALSKDSPNENGAF